MKKQLSLTIIMIMLILSACSPNEDPKTSKTADAMIQPADLSKYEETLLKAGGAKKNLAFDYNVKGTDIQYIHIWMDVYKNGKKQKRFIDIESLIRETENGHLLLTIQPAQQQVDDFQYQKWVTTLVSNNGYSHSTTLRKANSSSGMSASMELSNETKIEPGQPITLAVKLENPDAQSFSLSRTQFETEQDIAQKAKKYKRVSVLRCRFTKNEQLDKGSHQKS
ncbi:hypothetical protein [Tuberibacillus sp. Marseille-P3662]|uniref:hypothetical protein n=1 Tax=Tuberibacillus sp. Marseille-P3662 TaxID=1965358 RepID=UPI000A1CD728|nr:hypothetical protein [Tuberibacillus sp. Marseille-P3662]